MPARLKRILMSLLLALAICAPWTLIQSFAWLNMLATYSRQATFKQAFQMTFDGKHPCRLCQLARQTEQQHREQNRTCNAEDKLQLGLPPHAAFLFARPGAAWHKTEQSPVTSRLEPPPSPPPRFV